MADTVLKSSVRPDGVGVLTLARPDRLNSISTALAEALGQQVSEFASDATVRAIVVNGEGKVFSAGADIAELSTLSGPAAFGEFIGLLAASLDALADCSKPSVAALNGLAFGGGLELALACDLRVAEEGTRLGVPEIKLGLLPGAAGTVRLPRMVPPPVARRMLLTGEPILADEALRYGLVAEVVPAGAALDSALAWPPNWPYCLPWRWPQPSGCSAPGLACPRPRPSISSARPSRYSLPAKTGSRA
jgi:enoyl-CoA hydratase